MKNTLKYALLAASTLAVVTPAHAFVNGDLYIGFDGGGQDFIYDLGAASGLTSTHMWTIGANLGTRFGVVGSLNSGSHIFATSFDSAENGFTYNTALFNPARANISTLAGTLTVGQSRTTTSTDTTGWTYMTDQPPGTPGNTFQNNFFNPNVAVGSTAYFFDNSGLGETPDGSFTYDAASGVLTFSVTAVPEPAAYGILGGFGLLILAVRRQVVRA